MTKFQSNDGGRVASGFTAGAGDCVTRAVTVASGRPYGDVHKALSETVANEGDADKGVALSDDLKGWMSENGFAEYGEFDGPTYVGFDLNDPRFQKGRYVFAGNVNLGGVGTGHAVSMVDGVVHDDRNHTRYSTMFAYWKYTGADQQAA